MTNLSKRKTPEKGCKCKVTFNCSQWSLFPLASLPSSPWTIWGPFQLGSSLSTSFTEGAKLYTAYKPEFKAPDKGKCLYLMVCSLLCDLVHFCTPENNFSFHLRNLNSVLKFYLQSKICISRTASCSYTHHLLEANFFQLAVLLQQLDYVLKMTNKWNF